MGVRAYGCEGPGGARRASALVLLQLRRCRSRAGTTSASRSWPRTRSWPRSRCRAESRGVAGGTGGGAAGGGAAGGVSGRVPPPQRWSSRLSAAPSARHTSSMFGSSGGVGARALAGLCHRRAMRACRPPTHASASASVSARTMKLRGACLSETSYAYSLSSSSAAMAGRCCPVFPQLRPAQPATATGENSRSSNRNSSGGCCSLRTAARLRSGRRSTGSCRSNCASVR